MALSREQEIFRKSFIATFLVGWFAFCYVYFFDPLFEKYGIPGFLSTTPVTTQSDQIPVPDAPNGDLPPKHSAPPPPPPVTAGDVKVETTPTAKFKFGGIIDVEFSESNSWSTVFKIMAMILGVFFGIKAINAVFRKFA